MIVLEVEISELIANSFYELHEDLAEDRYTHYWIKGGRGSTKSSFISIEIILGMMRNSTANAVVLRKVERYIKDSVFEQLLWAIDTLGAEESWKQKLNPLELVYLPTGQKIIFRGADNHRRLKSTKFKYGYCRYIWFEEVDEFKNMDEIRSINQSLMRGGDKIVVFYSYNPPSSKRNWVNNESIIKMSGKKVHHSSYLDVPKDWLGEQFLIEAEHLKTTKTDKYLHEYIGEVIGTGCDIFTNVTIREIMDEEIAAFDNVKRGIDFGYATDPFCYGAMHYDSRRRRLIIFFELYKTGLSNMAATEIISAENEYNQLIVADSSEPKSIDEMRGYGLRVSGAKKGPHSIEYGIKFLQDMEEIVIDNVRCPNISREFLKYGYDIDKNGLIRANYPDRNNHSIDMCRYALEHEMRNRSKRRNFSGKGAMYSER